MTHRLRFTTKHGTSFEREVPETGLSVGRSERNDVVLDDALLSRDHCRFSVSGGALYVSDLATVNGTIVDGVAISEDVRLGPGSRILLGETDVLVLPEVSASASTAGDEPRPLDLGLHTDAPKPAAAPSRKLVGALIFGVIVFVLILAVGKVLMTKPEPAALTKSFAPDVPLSFSYEKTIGGAESVFRYEMNLTEEGILTVAIDELAEDRHVRKSTPKPLTASDREDLTSKFARARLFDRDAVREGIPRPNQWETRRISALVGGKAVTVSVRNCLPDPAFAELCEQLETFGRNELGLWAFAQSREQLVSLATESVLQANRLYEEREVRTENLFRAFRAYDSAVVYLESLEPKPPVFDEAVAGRDKAARELDAFVADCNWRADHAINIKDWTAACDALRLLLDAVPDRADDRHVAAEKRLQDVSLRLKKN